MAINHEVKNVENDTPGFLVDKFSKDGRVHVRSTIENNITINLDFYIETKDLLGHLLKPSVPYNISMVDTIANFAGYTNVVCPCIFPDGIVNSITLPNSNVNNINKFEIAIFGNNKNQFVGSTKWFYCTIDEFTPDENGTFTYTLPGSRKAIIPFSYNFVCIKINATNVLCKTVSEIARSSLMDADIQYNFYGDIASVEEITQNFVSNKFTADKIPYFQFDVLKGI